MRVDRHWLASILLTASTLALPLAGFSLPVDEQLTRLQVHLEKVRDEIQLKREWSSGLLVGTGAIAGTVGVVAAFSQYPTDGESDREIRNGQILSSLLAGSLYVGSGALVYWLRDEAETMPERFFQYPDSTDAAKALKAVAGEVTLEGLADRGRTDRLKSAGLLGLAGTLVLGLSTPWGTVGGASSGRFDYTGLTAGTGLLFTALFDLALESTAESENRAYLRWKLTAASVPTPSSAVETPSPAPVVRPRAPTSAQGSASN